MDRKVRLPALKGIEAFVLVARTRSFSRAAEALSITQSAVSKRIQLLEQQLDAQLLSRSTTTVNLTAAGRRYLKHASAAFDGLYAASIDIADATRRRRVVLRVTPSLAIGWLAPHLERFEAFSPEIELVLDMKPYESTLGSDDVDLMISFGLPEDWVGLVAEPIAPTEIYPLVSPRIAANLAGDPRQALLRYRPIQLKGFEPLWALWRDRMEIALDYGQPPLVLDNLMLCHEAAAHGLGVALGSDIVSGAWIRAGTLVDPFGARVATDATFHLVASTQWRPGRGFQAVLAWLRATLDDADAPGSRGLAYSLEALASASNS